MKLGSDRASDIKTREQLGEFENIVDVYIVDIEGDVLVFQLLLKYIGDEVVDVELHADGFFNLGRADKRENTCKEVVNNNAQTVCVDEVDKLGDHVEYLVNGISHDLVDSVANGIQNIIDKLLSLISVFVDVVAVFIYAVFLFVDIIGIRFELAVTAHAAESFKQVAERLRITVRTFEGNEGIVDGIVEAVVFAGLLLCVEECVISAEEEPVEKPVSRFQDKRYAADECSSVVYKIDLAGVLCGFLNRVTVFIGNNIAFFVELVGNDFEGTFSVFKTVFAVGKVCRTRNLFVLEGILIIPRGEVRTEKCACELCKS